MITTNTLLLASFIVVVVVQALNRKAGAIAAIVWCLGLSGYGVWMFQTGADLSFLGRRVELWHFLTFMAVMLAYNGWVLSRLLRGRGR